MNEIRKMIMVPNRRIRSNQEITWSLQQAVTFIELMNLCQQTNSFPRDGGLLDQDSFYIFLLKNALIWQENRRVANERRTSKQTSSAYRH